MRESEILKHCLLAAAECGAFAWRNNRGMFLTLDGSRKVRAGLEAPGSADIIGLYRGRFLAIELKTAKGRASTDQQKFIDIVNRNGGLAFVARSPEDIKKALTDCERLV